MFVRLVRLFAVATLTLGVVACHLRFDEHSGCVTGPCDVEVGPYPVRMVAGISSSRISDGAAHVRPGDTLQLAVA